MDPERCDAPKDVPEQMQANFEKELESLINRHSQENASNTPDFILAQYILSCLLAFNTAVQQRETWYGREDKPKVGQIHRFIKGDYALIALNYNRQWSLYRCGDDGIGAEKLGGVRICLSTPPKPGRID